MYERGVDVLLAPTWDNSDEWVPTLRHIAKEGQIFVVGVTAFLRGSDVPRDLSDADQLYGGEDDFMSRGNTTIVAPGGELHRRAADRRSGRRVGRTRPVTNRCGPPHVRPHRSLRPPGRAVAAPTVMRSGDSAFSTSRERVQFWPLPSVSASRQSVWVSLSSWPSVRPSPSVSAFSGSQLSLSTLSGNPSPSVSVFSGSVNECCTRTRRTSGRRPCRRCSGSVPMAPSNVDHSPSPSLSVSGIRGSVWVTPFSTLSCRPSPSVSGRVGSEPAELTSYPSPNWSSSVS